MEKRKSEYDVVIVGGGIAGVSSALSAAREKKSVLLIEANYALGGLATLGLVVFYLPLDDGEGKQIANGIAEELLQLSVSHDQRHQVPKNWKQENKRYEVEFNPSLFSLLLEEKLRQEGIDILFGTTLIDVSKDGDFISSLDLVTRSSHLSVKGKAFIDATGDASLCAYAGEETAITMNGNTLAYWRYENNALKMDKGFHFRADSFYEYEGIEPFDVTSFTIETHKALLRDFLLDGDESEKHMLTRISVIPEFRMTRKLKGKYDLSISDNHQFQADSVGIFPSWVKKGDAFELPYGSLIGKATKNLYVAGRNISTENDEMWNVIRSIPVCAVSGEAAGLLAANYPNHDEIDIRLIHEKMDRRGIIYHLKDIKD